MRSLDQNTATFQSVKLPYVTVKGQMDMEGASVERTFESQHLSVAGDLSMRNITADKTSFVVPLAQVGGNLDLTGSSSPGIDLHGASIAGELRVGDKQTTAAVAFMDLRDARVGSLSDNRDSWRGHLHPEGFVHPALATPRSWVVPPIGGTSGSGRTRIATYRSTESSPPRSPRLEIVTRPTRFFTTNECAKMRGRPTGRHARARCFRDGLPATALDPMRSARSTGRSPWHFSVP